MPLQKSHITVPFAGGIDEKQASQLLVDGMQSVVTNGVFTKNASIRKRYGSKVLGTDPASAPFKLNTFQGELVASCNDGQMRGFSTSTSGGNNWVVRNFAPEAVAQRVGLTSQINGVRAYDIAVAGNLACVVWISLDQASGNNSVFAEIIDLTNGSVVLGATKLNNNNNAAANPKVIVGGAPTINFVVFWSEPATGKLWAIKNTTPAVGTWTARATLRTDMASANGWFDVAALAGIANRGLLFFESTNAAPMFVALIDTSTPSIFSSALLANGQTGYTGIGVARSMNINDTHLWLAYAIVDAGTSATVTVLFAVSSLLVQNSALVNSIVNTGWKGTATRIGMVRTSVSPDNVMVVASPARLVAGDPATTGILSYSLASNGVPAIQTDTRRLHLHSAPFISSSGQVYITAFFDPDGKPGSTSTQVTAWLFEITKPGLSTVRQVATWAPTICTSISNTGQAQTCGLVSSPVSGQIVTLTDATVTNTHNTLQLVTIDFSQGLLQMGSELGHNLNLGGGVPSYYDGAGVAEIGFLTFPEIGITLTQGAGGNQADGTYQYAVVYEWYDAQGQYHQSAPSVAKQIVIAAGGGTASVAVKVPCLNVTQRESGGTAVGIAIYRTQVGLTVLHRVSADNLPAANFNVAANDFVTITDTSADATIASARVLYTTSGALSHQPPPSASVCITHKQRIWLAGGDDPRNVWFSGTISDGEPPWFSLAFIQRFEEPITALASMDGRLIAFSRYSIFVCDGDGPSDAGTGSDLTAPQRVNSPCGCIEPRSVVRIADGILFQSEQGLYLLSRSLDVSYYGRNVEDTIGNSTITSATILEDQSQQRFTTSAGPVVFYDDVEKTWSTAIYKDGSGLTPSPTGATKWGANGYVWCAGTSVFQEDKTTFLDAGVTWVPLTITTNWIKPQAAQGFGRVWNVISLAEYQTAHDFTMTIANDFATTITDTHTWSLATSTPPAPAKGGPLQLQMKPSQQKAEAIRISISDAAPTSGEAVGSGRGFYALALDLVLGVKQGVKKLPAVARF